MATKQRLLRRQTDGETRLEKEAVGILKYVNIAYNTDV